MTRITVYLFMIWILIHLPAAAGTTQLYEANPSPRDYLIDKLRTHDVVFMGTTHKQPRILQFIGSVLPHLRDAGVTHVALEIASDQQDRVQNFLCNGTGLDRIALHTAIDCPDYRHLLRLFRSIPAATRPHVLTVDLPTHLYGGPTDRDQWIARNLAAITRNHADAKILVIIGSLHVLRKLEWQQPIQRGNTAIYAYLRSDQPGLSLFTIVNLVSAVERRCDFSRRYGRMPDIQAIDLDRRFEGWTLGFTRWLAIRPAPPYELVDGIIFY